MDQLLSLHHANLFAVNFNALSVSKMKYSLSNPVQIFKSVLKQYYYFWLILGSVRFLKEVYHMHLG